MIKVQLEPSIKLGVIGLGKHATENLLPSLQLLSRAQIESVCCTRADHAISLARRFRVPNATDRWIELVSDPAVAAVIVAANPAVHFAVVQACLDHSKHVFVEKPPCVNSSELAQLIERQQRVPQIRVFVGYNYRYGHSFEQMAQLIARCGGAWLVRVRLVSSQPRDAGSHGTVLGNLLFNLGLHALDLAEHVAGELRLETSSVRMLGDRTEVILHLTSASSTRATVEVGNYGGRLDYRVEVVCRDGTQLGLDQFNRITIGNTKSTSFAENFGNSVVGTYEWPGRRGGYDRTGYRPELAAFLDSCVGGPGEQSLRRSQRYYQIMEEITGGHAV